MPDFSSYLESVGRHYEPWCRLYTPIDAVGQADRMEWFDFGFMVQTIVPKTDDPRETGDRAEKVERFTVLEGLRKYAGEQVLLVGRPGSGKSTALTQLLLEEALTPSPSPKFGRGEQEEEIGRVPVLVELRYWNEDGVMGLIRSFLVKFGVSAAEVDRTTLEGLLRSKKLLLLMDGLNELPSEAARQDVRRFRREFSGVAIVWTTRELGGESWGIEKQLEMQPLTPVQMKAFVMAYLPEQGEAMVRQLGERLREFGSTPLLLWMLCRVFAKEGRIPENLGEVFRVFTRGYERRVKQDVVGESDRRLWGELLKQLAARMMTGEKPTELRVAIGDREIYEVFSSYLKTSDPLVPRQALDDLLRHHLIQRNGELVEFRHQLIQEYYAAEWLLERVGRLNDETLKGEFLNYLKWTESVALMLALVEDEALAVRVVGRALEVDLMLGARLAGEVKLNLFKNMLKLLSSLDASKAVYIKLLGRTGSDEVVPILEETLADSQFLWNSIHALKNIDSHKSIHALVNAIQCKCIHTDRACDFVIEVLGSSSHVLASSYLMKMVENHSNESVRAFAARELWRFPGVDTIQTLFKAAALDKDDYVRQKASFALRKIGSLEAISAIEKAERIFYGESYDILTEAANMAVFVPKSSFKDSKSSALNIPSAMDNLKRYLSRNFNFEIKAKKLNELLDLMDKFLDHSDADLRLETIRALGEVDDSRAINLLGKALEDLNFDNRANAAFTLRNCSDVSVVTLLICAFNKEENILGSGLHVKFTIIEALGDIGKSEAISFLHQLILNNEVGLVDTIVEAIGKISDPQSINFLHEQLHSGKVKNVPISIQQICNIQSNCKFYNYEIEQQAKLRKADRTSLEGDRGDSSLPATITYNVKELTLMSEQQPIFNQQGATIGVNYAAENSNPKIIQNIQQEFQDTSLLAIVQIIQALEKKYTFVQDPQQAIDIIDAEFKSLEASRSPQWQNLLNIKRLYNGGKKAAVKVSEHFAQENVWGKGFVAFLEGVSEDVK